ncbi:retrovirus-related pol polyprotein from transposon TNT 1-94 [Tanacetum coccineum]
MLDNLYGDETLEELTAAVMMMAQIQPADGNAETVPSYDAKVVSEVNASPKVHEQNLKELQQELIEEIQDLLMAIYELKNKLKTIDKGKNVNTKFDNFETLGKLLCVTPFPKNIAVKDKKVSNNKVNANSSNSVKRPKSKDTKSKDRVLKNTNDKRPSVHVIQLVLWIVDSGCSKHMTGNLSLLRNFVEKFMGTVCFGNDHFVYFLHTKDEAPDIIIDFINQVKRNLKAQILKIQTEFKNEKLRSFYAKLGIVHNTSIARRPQQKGVVERRNRTLVEHGDAMSWCMISGEAKSWNWNVLPIFTVILHNCVLRTKCLPVVVLCCGLSMMPTESHVGHAHTPATVDTESEPEEAPLEIEEFEASKPSDIRITSSHSSASSDSTVPLSPDHPLTQTSPTPTPT